DPLEDDRDQRAAGDEADQLTEERLLAVLGVVLVGDRLGRGQRLEGGDPQPLALEAGDHLTSQGALEGVRLDEYQGPAHGLGSFVLVRWSALLWTRCGSLCGCPKISVWRRRVRFRRCSRSRRPRPV